MFQENMKVIVIGWVFIFLICVGVVFFISTSLKNQAVAQQEQFTELTEPEKKHVREIIQDLLTNPTSWEERAFGIEMKIFDKGKHRLLLKDTSRCSIEGPYYIDIDDIRSDSLLIAIRYADQHILSEDENHSISSKNKRDSYFNQPWSEKCEPPAETLRVSSHFGVLRK